MTGTATTPTMIHLRRDTRPTNSDSDRTRKVAGRRWGHDSVASAGRARYPARRGGAYGGRGRGGHALARAHAGRGGIGRAEANRQGGRERRREQGISVLRGFSPR